MVTSRVSGDTSQGNPGGNTAGSQESTGRGQHAVSTRGDKAGADERGLIYYGMETCNSQVDRGPRVEAGDSGMDAVDDQVGGGPCASAGEGAM